MSVTPRTPQPPKPAMPRTAHHVVRPKSIRLLLHGVWIAEGQYLNVCPWEGVAEVCSRAGSSTLLCSVLVTGDKCHHLTSPKHQKFSRSKDNTASGFCRSTFHRMQVFLQKLMHRKPHTCHRHPSGFRVLWKRVETSRICLSSPSVLAKPTRFLKWLFFFGQDWRGMSDTSAVSQSSEKTAYRCTQALGGAQRPCTARMPVSVTQELADCSGLDITIYYHICHTLPYITIYTIHYTI